MLAFREVNTFVQWRFLELRTVRFIPLLIGSGLFYKAQAGLKYFLSQAPVSVWLLIRIIFLDSSFLSQIFAPALFFKLALPPFHGWVFSIIKFIRIKEMALLLTLQKMLPTFIMENRSSLYVIYISIMLRVLLVLVLIRGVSDLKPILLLSSISGAFWPIIIIQETNIWIEFFLIYSMFLVTLCLFIEKFRLKRFRSLLKKSTLCRLMFCSQLLNLGGLPPLSGFFLKLFIIKIIMLENLRAIILLLGLSFLTLYIYIQISIPLLIAPPAKRNNINKTGRVALFFLLLPIIPFIIYF